MSRALDFIEMAALAQRAGMEVAEYSRLATPRAAASASHASVLKKLAGGGPGSLSGYAQQLDRAGGGTGRGDARLIDVVSAFGDEASANQIRMNGGAALVDPTPMGRVGQRTVHSNQYSVDPRSLDRTVMPSDYSFGFTGSSQQASASLNVGGLSQPKQVGTPLAVQVSEAQGPIPVKVTQPKAKAAVESNKPVAESTVGSKQAADITGYAGSMMGGVSAVGAGAVVGGVTSYATGGEFGQGAVAGGMVVGGAYLGMSTMASNSKAINAAVTKGGEGFGAGVMGAMQGANQVIGGASVAARRAALMGGAGLAGLTFGGNRRSHRRGFNQSRGSRI